MVTLALLAMCGCESSSNCPCFDAAPVDDAFFPESGVAEITAPTVDPLCAIDSDAAPLGECIAIDDADLRCNPITNAGCDGDAGESCDFTLTGFRCYGPPPPNTAGLCLTCDDSKGPACAPTTTCATTNNGPECARFCCTDNDCPSGSCAKQFGTHDAGVCVRKGP